jgi:hypothetical protein
MLNTIMAATSFGAVFVHIETKKCKWAKSLGHYTTLHTSYSKYLLYEIAGQIRNWLNIAV